MSQPAPLDVHVVTHTHWDREWYHPAGRFRQRLVALIDELLAHPPRGAFLLDGQAVVLEDYLAVRPECAGELGRGLRDGTIEAGPWYVLADELIPGGEALVRNLLVGRRVLRALRAEPPAVLYSPDAFGHPAVLPDLARGFGCGVIVAWRGYGGRRWPAGDAVCWQAPDGAEVLLYHLPPAGYELGSSLPPDEPASAGRWRAMRDVLAPRAVLGVTLVQNGADHHALQPAHDAALAALERVAAPDRVHASSLRAFVEALHERARHAHLPRVRGELRDSYGYTWTLQGTFATRAAQKRRNAAAERLLVRDAEPWAALAALRGGRRRSAETVAAWKTLLLAHPHDTLCGTSVDEVARAMDARLDDATTQGRGIRDDALLDLIGHDAAAARTARDRWRPVLIVRNPAARDRGGVAEVELLRFVRDVPVGPGSAGAPATAARRGAIAVDGGAIPVQPLARAERVELTESPRHYPDADLVDAVRAVAWIPSVAGYGTRALELRGGRGPALAPRHPVRASELALDNGLVRVAIEPDGRVALRAAGREIGSLVRLEDDRDVGDLYTPAPRGMGQGRADFLGARLIHRGPLRGELRARWRVRAAGRPASRVELSFILDADAPFLRVHVSGRNAARDHRLRIVLATGIAGAEVWADAAFGPVHRVPPVVPPEDAAMEQPMPTAPLHRYVTLHAAGRGATVYSDGLAEYEATADGEVAITLVRAVGELSRADLPERPGHAGWPRPTPEAQSPGPFAARFAILCHGARDEATIHRIERVADDVLLPLVGRTLRSALRVPEPTAGVELEGEGLAFSCARESESEGWMTLRCVNLTEREVSGCWRLGIPVTEARLARLDETPLGALSLDGGSIPFGAPPRGIVTILVR